MTNISRDEILTGMNTLDNSTPESAANKGLTHTPNNYINGALEPYEALCPIHDKQNNKLVSLNIYLLFKFRSPYNMTKYPHDT